MNGVNLGINTKSLRKYITWVVKLKRNCIFCNRRTLPTIVDALYYQVCIIKLCFFSFALYARASKKKL